jgi:hypothetical protein
MSLAKAYRTWNEIVVDSAMVVVGVVRTQYQEMGRHGVPETITTFEVETLVLERDGKGRQAVRVQQSGPIPPNMWVEDIWPLAVGGERYLLFLTPALQTGLHFPVGAYQGVYHVTSDDRVETVMPEIPSLRQLTKGARLENVLLAIRAVSDAPPASSRE